jgi:hypothetical protein
MMYLISKPHQPVNSPGYKTPTRSPSQNLATLLRASYSRFTPSGQPVSLVHSHITGYPRMRDVVH